MIGVSSSLPVIDNPYLSILINRRDLGHSFDLGVNKVNQNLVITGEKYLHFIKNISHLISGPPAPSVSFPGTASYYQRSYAHVQPFLAFQSYNGGGYHAQYL